MSNPHDPDDEQGRSAQGGYDPGSSSQGSYGQNPSGYGQGSSSYGQASSGYEQSPTGYDPNAGGYEQSPTGYDPNAGGYSPAPYGQGYTAPAGDHPQGTTILVLGIVGIFFTICAPIAWYMGSRAMKEIRASGTTYNNQQQIVIGRTLGIIFTILAIIGLVFAVLFLIIAFVAASQGAR